MIPHFSDHAANERTYLAWVRTALAIVGLGFLLERFDLFLAYLGHGDAASSANPAHHLRMTEWIGLLLIGFGTVIIFLATVRFIRQRGHISSAQTVHYRKSMGELILAALLCLLGVFLVFFVGHELIMLSS